MQTVQLVKANKHPVVRGVWRYLVTGRPIYGKGDNATYFRDATVDYRGGPVERLSRARWRRVARRHAALTVPGGLAICDWRAAAAYAGLAAAAGGAYGTRAFIRYWPQRAVRREFVVPTWTVTARV